MAAAPVVVVLAVAAVPVEYQVGEAPVAVLPAVAGVLGNRVDYQLTSSL